MKKKENSQAQILFFQKLKESLPTNISLAAELVDLLVISNDSSYRRIRGESILTLEELMIICKHYKLSFDSFNNNQTGNNVNFAYHQLTSHTNTFKDYLSSINNDLERMLKYPANKRQLMFAGEDIPLFQHFAHPYLTAFKIFYWNRSILNATGYEDKKFDANDVTPDLLELAKTIYHNYAKINSIEIWSDDTANSTLKQIEFYWEAGAFGSKADALAVCNEVKLMFARINKQAAMKVKLDVHNIPVSDTDNYSLYHSDIIIGNNCVQTNVNGQIATYISYHTFNSMVTTNTIFCNQTNLWFNNLIRKSNLISGVGEKQRYKFFNHLDTALNKLIAKIDKG